MNLLDLDWSWHIIGVSQWQVTRSRKLGSYQFSSVLSLSCVWLFATPWTAASQASLSVTNSQSFLKPMSIEWYYPTISSSVIPFSSCLQSFPITQIIKSILVVPVHQTQASSIVHRTWTGNSFHAWYYTCFNAILPLGRPRGMEWGGRREEGSGWGTHVYLWWIHFDSWQN